LIPQPSRAGKIYFGLWLPYLAWIPSLLPLSAIASRGANGADEFSDFTFRPGALDFPDRNHRIASAAGRHD
jgi:hypothetical protein